MKYLNTLEKKFGFALYTGGSNYRVGVEVDNIGYVINSDNSIMRCIKNGKAVNLNDLIELHKPEGSLDDLSEEYRLEVVADRVGFDTFMEFYILNEKVAKKLFNNFKIFKELIEEEGATNYKIV